MNQYILLLLHSSTYATISEFKAKSTFFRLNLYSIFFLLLPVCVCVCWATEFSQQNTTETKFSLCMWSLYVVAASSVICVLYCTIYDQSGLNLLLSNLTGDVHCFLLFIFIALILKMATMNEIFVFTFSNDLL